MAAVNIFGFCYFTFIISMTTYWGAFIIVPQITGTSTKSAFYHYMTIVFLAVNTAGNFINTMLTDTSIKKLYSNDTREMLKEVIEQYHQLTLKNIACKKCDIQVPPRCHHCVLCGTCILKRDHHCFFMCTCIGYHNQKYFVMFCVWQCIAGMYAIYIGSLYLNEVYGVKLCSLCNIVNFIPETIYKW